MYTVKEVAEKLNVTPQAIYKKMNNQMSEELSNHIQVVKRGKKDVKMFTEGGLEVLKESIGQPVEQPLINKLNNVEQPLINLLQETIETLRGQLDVKDAQIEAKDRQIDTKDNQIQELNNRLRELNELQRNNQVLLHREQEQKALPSSGWQKVKDFFKK